ncbi:MAG: hypothetical protein IT573_02565 [Deltaproteobacteria bacterium]|nr:hypothetical protein [Deltaproteobacteria bacterium]
MKKLIFSLALFSFALLPALSHADGYVEEGSQPRRSYRRAAAPAEEPVPAAPTCVSKSPGRKIELVSFDPKQPAGKIVGSIQECVTTMYDVLRLLAGPNVINLKYPEEKEQWGYLWLWSYQLQNPIEDTIILMDNSGKRIKKGKNPVELYITFNEHDIVDSVEMDLIKKKGNYVLFP